MSDIRIVKSGFSAARDVSGCGMTVWRGDQRSTFPSTRSTGSEIVSGWVMSVRKSDSGRESILGREKRMFPGWISNDFGQRTIRNRFRWLSLQNTL